MTMATRAPTAARITTFCSLRAPIGGLGDSGVRVSRREQLSARDVALIEELLPYGLVAAVNELHAVPGWKAQTTELRVAKEECKERERLIWRISRKVINDRLEMHERSRARVERKRPNLIALAKQHRLVEFAEDVVVGYPEKAPAESASANGGGDAKALAVNWREPVVVDEVVSYGLDDPSADNSIVILAIPQ
jgi:hypothetical protein